MLKKEIYTYEASWPLYALAWSTRGGDPSIQYRLAVGSFVEQYANKVAIVRYHAESDSFKASAVFDHPYPATKVAWMPDDEGARDDRLATTGDYLRLWKVQTNPTNVHEDNVELLCQFANNKNSEFCAPLTSMDWNRDDPTMIGTCSIDTTCTIWDLQKQQPRTQLIAHDEEVYDISFAKGWDRFATAGADGSIRMFDLRELEHSTIIYESAKKVPLLRVAWNEQDPNFLATVEMEAKYTTIIDIRMPTQPVARLGGHQASVTAFSWAPHSSCHIASSGDDSQALIWSLSSLPKPIEDPILAYSASSEINNMKWSSKNNEWIAICSDKNLQLLKV